MKEQESARKKVVQDCFAHANPMRQSDGKSRPIYSSAGIAGLTNLESQAFDEEGGEGRMGAIGGPGGGPSKGFKDTAREYMSASSVGGLSQMQTSSFLCFKLLWLAVFCVGLGFTVYNV